MLTAGALHVRPACAVDGHELVRAPLRARVVVAGEDEEERLRVLVRQHDAVVRAQALRLLVVRHHVDHGAEARAAVRRAAEPQVREGDERVADGLHARLAVRRGHHGQVGDVELLLRGDDLLLRGERRGGRHEQQQQRRGVRHHRVDRARALSSTEHGARSTAPPTRRSPLFTGFVAVVNLLRLRQPPPTGAKRLEECTRHHARRAAEGPANACEHMTTCLTLCE